ncbi:hypothetical protein [Nocardioides aquaticus]|uniref:hypothetical protein n=1 Tax=Nocardioides aquaticus TaxID=160826 RepID=UPI001BD323BB|nr:hypothetical protein [Nocardioides aquaticus]
MKKANERRVVEARVAKTLAEFYDDADAEDLSPMELYALARRGESAKLRAVRQMVTAEEVDLSAGLLELMDRLHAGAARVAKIGIDANVGERQLAFAQEQASLLGAAFAGALTDGKADPEVATAVLSALGVRLRALGL